MRILGAAIFLALVAVVGAAGHPEGATGCSGSVLEFEDAIRLSDGAIYAGRVIDAETAGEAWTDLTIDIDLVVRGPASRHVPRAQAGVACDGIVEGEWGYVVRGVHDALDPRATNLFFRISPATARDVLRSAGLPDTSTVPDAETQTRPSVPWAWLALVFATAFVMASRVLRGPERDDPIR